MFLYATPSLPPSISAFPSHLGLQKFNRVFIVPQGGLHTLGGLAVVADNQLCVIITGE